MVEYVNLSDFIDQLAKDLEKRSASPVATATERKAQEFLGNTNDELESFVNIYDEGSNHIIEIEAGGMSVENVSAYVDEENRLIVSYSNIPKTDEKKIERKYYRHEFETEYSDTLAFKLDPKVWNLEKTNIVVKNGVITIIIPKLNVTKKSKKININVQ